VVDLARATVFTGPAGRCPPLTWTALTPPARWALLSCVNGHECCLSSDLHQVAADGTVTPSAVCPVTGCGWHEFIRLLGWTPPA